MTYIPNRFEGGSTLPYAITTTCNATMPLAQALTLINPDSLRTYPDFKEVSGQATIHKYASVAKYEFKLNSHKFSPTGPPNVPASQFCAAVTVFIMDSINVSEGTSLGTMKVKWYMEFRGPKYDIYDAETPVSALGKMKM